MKNFLLNTKNNILKLLQKKEVQIFLITLGLHILVAVFFLITNLSLFSNGGDSSLYHESGTAIAQLIRNGVYHLGDVYPHHWFPLLVGMIYFIFGSSMTVGVVMNTVVAALSAVLFYKILKESGVSEKISFLGSLIIMNGYASFVYHSSILLKEAWVVMLLLVIIYLSIQMVKGKGNRFIIFGIFLVLFTLLRSLRFFIGFAGAAGFFMTWFLQGPFAVPKRILAGIGMILIVIGLGWGIQGLPLIKGMTLISALNPNLIHVTRRYSSETASTATHTSILKKKSPEASPKISDSPLTGGLVSNVKRLDEEKTKYHFSMVGFFKALLSTVLGPFPWQVSLVKYAVLFVDVVFVYGIIGISLIGIVKMKLKNIVPILPWGITAGGIILAVTLGADNIGAIVRQRIPAVVVIGLIACYSIHYIWNYQKKSLSQI